MPCHCCIERTSYIYREIVPVCWETRKAEKTRKKNEASEWPWQWPQKQRHIHLNDCCTLVHLRLFVCRRCRFGSMSKKKIAPIVVFYLLGHTRKKHFCHGRFQLLHCGVHSAHSHSNKYSSIRFFICTNRQNVCDDVEFGGILLLLLFLRSHAGDINARYISVKLSFVMVNRFSFCRQLISIKWCICMYILIFYHNCNFTYQIIIITHEMEWKEKSHSHSLLLVSAKVFFYHYFTHTTYKSCTYVHAACYCALHLTRDRYKGIKLEFFSQHILRKYI